MLHSGLSAICTGEGPHMNAEISTNAFVLAYYLCLCSSFSAFSDTTILSRATLVSLKTTIFLCALSVSSLFRGGPLS